MNPSKPISLSEAIAQTSYNKTTKEKIYSLINNHFSNSNSRKSVLKIIDNINTNQAFESRLIQIIQKFLFRVSKKTITLHWLFILPIEYPLLGPEIYWIQVDDFIMNYPATQGWIADKSSQINYLSVFEWNHNWDELWTEIPMITYQQFKNKIDPLLESFPIDHLTDAQTKHLLIQEIENLAKTSLLRQSQELCRQNNDLTNINIKLDYKIRNKGIILNNLVNDSYFIQEEYDKNIQELTSQLEMNSKIDKINIDNLDSLVDVNQKDKIKLDLVCKEKACEEFLMMMKRWLIVNGIDLEEVVRIYRKTARKLFYIKYSLKKNKNQIRDN